MRIRVTFFALLALFSQAVFAGGSWEAVSIASFRSTSDVDYVLVISLVPRGPTDVQWQDPMFRGCTRLEIHGTFGALRAKGRFAWFVDTFSPPEHPSLTKAKHVDAIAFLGRAMTEQRIVNFGYIGTGFVPANSGEPCVVASRALELHNEHGSTAVFSFHDDY